MAFNLHSVECWQNRDSALCVRDGLCIQYELAQDLIWQVRHREKGTCCYGLNVHERRADLCTMHMNVKCHIQSCKWYMKFHFLIANLRKVEVWWQLVFHHRDPIGNMFGSPQHNVVNKHRRHNSYKAGWHYNICSTLHSSDLQCTGTCTYTKYLQMENSIFWKGKEIRSSERKVLQSTSQCMVMIHRRFRIFQEQFTL